MKRLMKTKNTCLALITFILLLPLTANAVPIQFDDRATFLASGGMFTEHANFNDFTITSGPDANAFIDTGTTYSTLFSPNPYIAISGVENFDVFSLVLSGDIFAFGMDVHEPFASTAVQDGCNVVTCIDSTFLVELKSSGVSVGSVSFNPANDQLAFFGVVSDVAFDQIVVRETTGTNDNEFFGNFITKSTAVPEPSIAILMASGLIAFGVVRRKCRA